MDLTPKPLVNQWIWLPSHWSTSGSTGYPLVGGLDPLVNHWLGAWINWLSTGWGPGSTGYPLVGNWNPLVGQSKPLVNQWIGAWNHWLDWGPTLSLKYLRTRVLLQTVFLIDVFCVAAWSFVCSCLVSLGVCWVRCQLACSLACLPACLGACLLARSLARLLACGARATPANENYIYIRVCCKG